jgi:hypothetical protein
MSDNDPENDGNRWDFERAERRSSTRRPRAVVSVAFSRDDFDHVATMAEALEMKVSEFIRTAALAAAGRQSVIHFGADLDVSRARWSYVPIKPEPEMEDRTDSESRYPMERVIA